jgi:AcrR family transcriptional regulator
MTSVTAPTPVAPVGVGESRVLDAAKRACAKWGFAKVTVDDIAAEAGISRATLYRLFPGGKDVLFDAMRERETADFLTALDAHLADADSFEDLLVRIVVGATLQLRADDHLQMHLAAEPGEVVLSLTFDSLPRIVRLAAAILTPRVEPHIGSSRAEELAEWLSRVVISYFLTPSSFADLGDPTSARRFVRSFVLPAFAPIQR